MPHAFCFACGSSDLMPFYEQTNIPVNSCLLMPTRQEALEFPRGDLRLTFCRRCGFIQNALFDPARIEYSSRYEETQGFSPKFVEYANELACHLVSRYNLQGKDVLEIGCGKGEFLEMLARRGQNRCIGIDPTYLSERTPDDVSHLMSFITDFYSEDYLHLKADFYACRHTLEHIQPVSDFVGLVRRAIGERRDPVVFFDIPDTARVLQELAFWDVYYEHCSYFSLGSLARCFRANDFDVFDLSLGYGGQWLQIEAVAANGGDGPYWEAEDDMAELARLVGYFRDNAKTKQKQWARQIQKARMKGEKVVLWGSGSKAVAYLTTMDVKDELEFVVDINPHKHGQFLAGSGHEIVAPEFLREYQPDAVIAMNSIYLEEIQNDLDRLGIKAELSAV